jgi:imidazole glycerol-phosphate synthase subunit HisH
MIAITDYGLGNVKAFANVYYRLNIPVIIARESGDFRDATKIILPGVGSFDYAMQRLNDSGMRETLENKVLNEKVPVIGICVGMQMLAKKSEEGLLPGLGWIEGEVKRFVISSNASTMRIPHMGWNTIKPLNTIGLLEGMDAASRFYFLHSYYFKCSDTADVLATTNYDGEFECAVNYKNIYGVQFHPEKSHGWGVKLLENFAKL